jgi:hypothetical protein
MWRALLKATITVALCPGLSAVARDPQPVSASASDPRRMRAAAVLAAALTVGSAVTAGAQTLLVEDFGSRWPEAPLAMQGPAAAQEVPPAIEKGAVALPGARPPASGPVVAGSWSGTVTQVGRQSKYTVALTITAKGGETDYPEQGCGGKLTRIGMSSSYAFFVETITRGHVNKGGRCLDGTITVTRVGENLGWEWFGTAQDDVIVAWGTPKSIGSGGCCWYP